MKINLDRLKPFSLALRANRYPTNQKIVKTVDEARHEV